MNNVNQTDWFIDTKIGNFVLTYANTRFIQQDHDKHKWFLDLQRLGKIYEFVLCNSGVNYKWIEISNIFKFCFVLIHSCEPMLKWP